MPKDYYWLLQTATANCKLLQIYKKIAPLWNVLHSCFFNALHEKNKYWGSCRLKRKWDFMISRFSWHFHNKPKLVDSFLPFLKQFLNPSQKCNPILVYIELEYTEAFLVFHERLTYDLIPSNMVTSRHSEYSPLLK